MREQVKGECGIWRRDFWLLAMCMDGTEGYPHVTLRGLPDLRGNVHCDKTGPLLNTSVSAQKLVHTYSFGHFRSEQKKSVDTKIPQTLVSSPVALYDIFSNRRFVTSLGVHWTVLALLISCLRNYGSQ